MGRAPGLHDGRARIAGWDGREGLGLQGAGRARQDGRARLAGWPGWHGQCCDTSKTRVVRTAKQ